MKFSDNLKKLRKEHNFTQKDVALKIYVSRSLIAKYENGTVFPTEENLAKLAQLFNVNILELKGINELTPSVLKISKKRKKIIFIINILIIALSILYLIFLFLPVFKDYKYEYPIPDGQNQPNLKVNYYSIFSANIISANYVVIFSLVLTVICFVLSIWSLMHLNKHKFNSIRYINYIFFVILLFLIFASFIGCTRYLSLDY